MNAQKLVGSIGAALSPLQQPWDLHADRQVSTMELPTCPQGGTGQLESSVDCMRTRPRSRVQPPPLFAPPLSVIDIPRSRNLTVTQHFSVRIASGRPELLVPTSSPSTLFASGLALWAQSDLPCRNLSLAPTRFTPSPTPPRPRSSSRRLSNRHRSRGQNERESA